VETKPNLGKLDRSVTASERHLQSRSLQNALDSLALQPTTRDSPRNLKEATPMLCQFRVGIDADQFDLDLLSSHFPLTDTETQHWF